MANGLEKHCTYAVDGAEEELTMWQRSDVQLAGTEKQLLLKHIRGELRISTGRDCTRIFVYCGS